MVRPTCPSSRWHRAAVIVPALFGLLSIIAGGQVLLGIRLPDHAIVRPLLYFNTLMGFVYIAAALRIRRDAAAGRVIAGVIALVNAVAWAALIAFAAAGGAVATDSMIAMAIRTVLWGSIWVVLGRVVAAPRVEHA